MTLRIFHCHDCGHKMRFSGIRCHKCYARKATYQMPWFWLTVIGVAIAGAMAGAIAII